VIHPSSSGQIMEHKERALACVIYSTIPSPNASCAGARSWGERHPGSHRAGRGGSG
jgi:hypothetical protein